LPKAKVLPDHQGAHLELSEQDIRHEVLSGERSKRCVELQDEHFLEAKCVKGHEAITPG
jgi:hypothetical protein